MKQLAAFMVFLTELDLVAAEQITSYVDKVQLLPSGKIKGATVSPDTCVICRQKYTAMIDIERFPHAVHSPALLFAHVSGWLIDHDKNRYDLTDSQPEIIVDVLDEQTADVLIEIEFVEEVLLVSDNSGAIALAGKQWRLVP